MSAKIHSKILKSDFFGLFNLFRFSIEWKCFDDKRAGILQLLQNFKQPQRKINVQHYEYSINKFNRLKLPQLNMFMIDSFPNSVVKVFLLQHCSEFIQFYAHYLSIRLLSLIITSNCILKRSLLLVQVLRFFLFVIIFILCVFVFNKILLLGGRENCKQCFELPSKNWCSFLRKMQIKKPIPIDCFIYSCFSL